MEKFDKNDNLEQKLEEISSELNKSIKEFNDSYLKSEKGYDYTPPKSFLELIKYFQELVGRKDGDITAQIKRLEKGLAVVANASGSISGLKKEIEVKTVILEEEKKNTSEVLVRLEVDKKKLVEKKK